MLKQGCFINKQFKKLLLGNLVGGLAYAINLMTDSIISGIQLGETALEAVSIVYPLYSVMGLFSYLLPLGISILFGKAIGAFRKEEAYRIAGTGLIASVLLGLFLAAALWLLKMPFLSYYECTGVLLQDASAYYNWLIFCALINPLDAMIYYLDITDGESAIFSVASVIGVLENIILSVVLSRIFGIAGLGMATFLYALLMIGCYFAHLLKKSNNLKFRFCLDIRILKRAVVLSFSDYMYYLFLAVVDIVLNKIIIASCGLEYIPAYTVINLAFSLCEIFIVVNNASIGLVTCFLGERNNHDMLLVFRQISRAVLLIAAALAVLLFFGAPLIPVIYGLETPATVKAAVFASRVMAFTTLGFGACYVGGSISSNVEKPLQACFISFLNDVFSPLLLSLVFGSVWGFPGIAVGMSLSSYFSIGLYTLISIIQRGPTGFPMYTEDFGGTASSYDLYVTPEALAEFRSIVRRDLATNGFQAENIDLLLDNFFTRMMERNQSKKVLAECTLLYDADKVSIIVRDDGVLEKTAEKSYLLTASFNRSGFVFSKKGIPTESPFCEPSAGIFRL